MRFMMIVKSNAKSEAGVLPDEKSLAEMGKYNEELVKAGAMLSGDGLKASSHGARVRISGKGVAVIDGPFAETKELVAGYWIIQVKSKEEAVAWAKRVPFQEGEVELRPLFEMEDFPVDPAEKPDGWRDQEQRFRDNAEASPPARKPGTTRYLVLIKADQRTESATPPDEKVLSEMGALMQETAASGALLGGEGLKPSSEGVRVRYSGSKRTVIDGPFTESKELVAGFSVIQVETKQQAIDFARRCLQIHVNWSGLGEGEIEVRPFMELEDFPVDPAEKPDGWRQQEKAFRDRTGQ